MNRPIPAAAKAPPPLLTARALDWEPLPLSPLARRQRRTERVVGAIAAIVLIAGLLVVGHLEYIDQVAVERYREQQQQESAR